MSDTLLMPVRELIRFLVWWAGTMPLRLWKIGWGMLLSAEDNLRLMSNLRLWFTLEPLFGDYGWKGRLIGFLLRGIRIFITLIIHIFLLILCVVLVLGWYSLPVWAVLSIMQYGGIF